MHAKSYFAFILGFCFAVLSFPALASEVIVGHSPTTGYSVVNNSVQTPANATVSGVKDITPHVTKNAGGGMGQTMRAGITITGVKEKAPFTMRANATLGTLKNGAKGFLTKGNLAYIVGSAGLQELLNGVGWIINEGGKISSIPSNFKGYPSGSFPEHGVGWRLNTGETGFMSPDAAFDFKGRDGWWGSCETVFTTSINAVCRGSLSGTYIHSAIYTSIDSCPSGYTFSDNSCSIPPDYQPVSDSDIFDAVDSSYVPDFTDWGTLTSWMMPDSLEITSAPTLSSPPTTKTIYDADGNPIEIQETNIWHDFDIRDNNTAKPKIDITTKTKTDTFKDGAKTGSSTTSSTGTATSSSNKTTEQLEIPTDCDLFPTACAWMDWTKEPPVEPPETDVSGLLQEIPVEMKTYTITGAAATCPAPKVLALGIYGSPEISYQPFCDLADLMKPLYLALMAFLSSVIIWRGMV